MAQRSQRSRLGIDTGGTFTDIVLEHAADGRLETHKTPSTPDDPAQAVITGIRWAQDRVGPGHALDVVHGTTVGLNAILTGDFAKTAWITNAGTRDLVEIGRQDRTGIYDLHPHKPQFPVPRELRFEVQERRAADGTRIARASGTELRELRAKLERAGVEAVAIGLLHGFAYPEDEQRIAKALRGLKVPISCSGTLLPAIGEYERFSAAAINAAIAPKVGSYVALLSKAVDAPGTFRLMRSSGGIMSADEARIAPARAVFSGPAGGVSAAADLAAALGVSRLATLDMGGTSTDVALVNAPIASDAGTGQDERSREGGGPVRDAMIAGLPLPFPSMDVHTIGCGGGSIATVDAGGALRTGPESAGARPGPACYGFSDLPTVTDAHVVLGNIGPDTRLGGSDLDRSGLDGSDSGRSDRGSEDGMSIDPARAERAIDRIARKLGRSRESCALGILEVAETAMLRALLVISVERAIDPETLPLVAFGGAGALHAASLAAKLRMPFAFVPEAPGAFSAVGLALARESNEVVIPVLRDLASLSSNDLRAILQQARSQALAGLEEQSPTEFAQKRGRSRAAAVAKTSTGRVRLRFAGQGEGLWIPCSARSTPAQLTRDVRAQHLTQFGFCPDRDLECVEVAATATTRGQGLGGFLGQPATSDEDQKGRVRRAPKPTSTRRGHPVYARRTLQPGDRVVGTAWIEESTAVTVVPMGWEAQTTPLGLRLSRSPAN